MHRITLIWAAAISVSALMAGPGCGQTAAPNAGQATSGTGENKTGSDAAPGVAGQPKPEELLRQMADYLSGLPAFSCRAAMTIDIEAEGHKNSSETKMIVRLERPNKLALVLDSGGSGMTIISDGSELVHYLPSLNRYVVSVAPQDFATWDESQMQMLGVAGQLLPLSAEKFYKQLSDGVTGSEYLGLAKVGDVECHHLKFLQESFNWELWIAVGEKPLPQKFVPDYSQRFGAGENVKVEYVVTFADWDVAPQFTDADFMFEPPQGAEKVDSLFEGLEGSEEGPHPLLGQDAPAFETVDLDGKPIDLKNHLGKDVVMLDFWATWCGPCVQAMPEVEGVAKKFVDRGLVFYAVNVGEDVDTIREFLKTSELEVPVAMDQESSISGLFRVEGIPQTVLIGKDGTVQVVHVGFSPALADELTSEIEDLLAGKDLAAEVLAKAEAEKETPAGDEADDDSIVIEAEQPAEDEATDGATIE